MKPLKILVADDQQHIRHSLELLLSSEGYQILEAASPDSAIDVLKSCEIHLVIMDMNYAKDTTSGDEGIVLIQKIRELAPLIPIVVMTAWGKHRVEC